MASELLLLRADGGARIGAGHLMRCLALAQAWVERGGGAVFAVHAGGPWFDDRIRAEGFERIPIASTPGSEADARETRAAAETRRAGRLALDGYRFDTAYQRHLYDTGRPLIVIDDFAHHDAYHADLLLDQNLGVTADSYRDAASGARLLLGPRHALLRREFREEGEERPVPARAGRILLSLGGTVAPGLAGRLLGALEPLLADPGGPRLVLLAREDDSLRARIDDSVEWHRHADNLPGLMGSADLAVAAAGSTCWELARTGVPMILLSLADNQRPVAEGLARENVAVDLGPAADLEDARLRAEVAALARDPERRRAMAARGRQLVDGEGAARVAMALSGDAVRLRPARPADRDLLFEWVNDAAVRASAFDIRPISAERHGAWFNERLADPRTSIFIALDDRDEPVGQVRFEETSAGEAVIDVSVAPARRGAGSGARLIDAGTRRMFAAGALDRIHAYIRPENAASLRAFERAGFRALSDTEMRGQRASHWVREKAS